MEALVDIINNLQNLQEHGADQDFYSFLYSEHTNLKLTETAIRKGLR
jgi:uncharacterized protein YkuJ